MVDRAQRTVAASAIEAYLRGDTTNDEFASQFPRATREDAALLAVETMVRQSQSDLKVHKYEHRTEELSGLLQRCIVFLNTDLPYEWPQENFIGLGGAPTIWELLSLGLLDRSEKRHTAFMESLRASGDFSIWPFIRRSDFESALATQSH